MYNMRYGYKNRRTAKKGGATKKRAPARRSNKSIRTIAKQVIHQMSENKHMTPLVGLGLRVDQALTTPSQSVNLTPILVQGVAQGDRIGNSVRTMKSKLLLQLTANQLTASGPNPGPNYFDVYLYKYKPSNEQTDIDQTKFLQFGNTAVPYDGGPAPYSGLLNMNSDLFIKRYHRRVRLWNPAPGSATDFAPDYAWSSMAQNGTTLTIDTTKFLNKTLKYNDNSSLPTNDNLFLSVVSSAVDGRNLGGSVGSFTFVHQFSFEDA